MKQRSGSAPFEGLALEHCTRSQDPLEQIQYYTLLGIQGFSKYCSYSNLLVEAYVHGFTSLVP